MPIFSDIVDQDYRDEPYWWRHARPFDPGNAELPGKIDVAVIGSGYAGLRCAIELARAGRSVVVLDALQIGEGASTRAAGLVSGRAGVSKQINLVRAVGEQRATAILDEADTAFEDFRDFIGENDIDCDFEPVGRFVGANTSKAYAKLAEKTAEYNSDGKERFRMVEQADQSEYVKSDFFKGGMLTLDAGSIHSSKYHAGLVRVCLNLGVRLVGNTRVTGIVASGAQKTIETSRGKLQAGEVMMGTGGYTDGLSTWHQRRIIPMSSTIIATQNLGRDRVRELLPAGMPVIDTKRVICFARPSPDGAHILFGGRARFTPISAERSVEILYDQMLEVFPELEGARVINSWSGFMAFTFDFLPKIGRHEDIHYAMACNGGSGIVMMSWLGKKAAGNILGLTEQKSAFEGLDFKTKPMYSGKPWFLPVVGNWYRFRDWLDRCLDS